MKEFISLSSTTLPTPAPSATVVVDDAGAGVDAGLSVPFPASVPALVGSAGVVSPAPAPAAVTASATAGAAAGQTASKEVRLLATCSVGIEYHACRVGQVQSFPGSWSMPCMPTLTPLHSLSPCQKFALRSFTIARLVIQACVVLLEIALLTCKLGTDEMYYTTVIYSAIERIATAFANVRHLTCVLSMFQLCFYNCWAVVIGLSSPCWLISMMS